MAEYAVQSVRIFRDRFANVRRGRAYVHRGFIIIPYPVVCVNDVIRERNPYIPVDFVIICARLDFHTSPLYNTSRF